MSCAITEVLLRDNCRESAGVEEIYIQNFDGNGTTFGATTSGAIISITSSSLFYLHETLDEKIEFGSPVVFGDADGIAFEHSVTYPIYNLTQSKLNKIKLLAVGRFRVIVKTRAGRYFLLGKGRGLRATEIPDLGIGQALDGMNGSTVTLGGRETDTFIEVEAAALAGMIVSN
jgi:hypothetical protein